MFSADRVNVAMLVVRLAFGVGFAAHGFNKVFGGGRLPGTTRWFASIGMRWPALQARLAAGTEMTSGLLLAAGLLTPLAAAGMIGVMVVAFWTTHRDKGFFIIHEGWEFVAAISVAAWAVATIGPGKYSLDHALDIEWSGWSGSLVAALLGVGAGAAQLLAFHRPSPTEP